MYGHNYVSTTTTTIASATAATTITTPTLLLSPLLLFGIENTAKTSNTLRPQNITGTPTAIITASFYNNEGTTTTSIPARIPQLPSNT